MATECGGGRRGGGGGPDVSVNCVGVCPPTSKSAPNSGPDPGPVPVHRRQKLHPINLGAKPRRATLREALHVRNGKELARPASVLT